MKQRFSISSSRFLISLLLFAHCSLLFFACGQERSNPLDPNNQKYQPLMVTVTQTGIGEVTVSWGAVDNPSVVGYRVYQNVGEGLNPSLVWEGAGTSAVIAGLVEGGEYHFMVSVVDDEGFEGEATAPVGAIISSKTFAPANLTSTAETSGHVDLTWEDRCGNEEGYVVERKVEVGAYEKVGTVGADIVVFTDSSVVMGTTYFYRVYVFRSQEAVYSGEVKASVPWSAKGIASGHYHTCAVTDQGGVKCWGGNDSGQLGDGTGAMKGGPINVTGLNSGVSAVSTGGYHTCALMESGGVKCWGFNGSGRLGDGTTDIRTVPVDVVGLTNGVAAISAGGGHTCALTNSGGVKCWGNNSFGQLGDGTEMSSSVPMDVLGLTSGVVAVSAGSYHTCALTVSGGVKCWGYNKFGQLGNNAPWSRPSVPVDVVGLTNGVAAVSAGGYHTCVLMISGGVKCWGRNGSGQLGDGTSDRRTLPVDVTGLTSGVQAVSAGYRHSCAVTGSGELKCWGWNEYAQLGDLTAVDRWIPVDAGGLTNGMEAVSSGEEHTCTLAESGTLKCWGYNLYGKLGNAHIGGHYWTAINVFGNGPR